MDKTNPKKYIKKYNQTQNDLTELFRNTFFIEDCDKIRTKIGIDITKKKALESVKENNILNAFKSRKLQEYIYPTLNKKDEQINLNVSLLIKKYGFNFADVYQNFHDFLIGKNLEEAVKSNSKDVFFFNPEHLKGDPDCMFLPEEMDRLIFEIKFSPFATTEELKNYIEENKLEIRQAQQEFKTKKIKSRYRSSESIKKGDEAFNILKGGKIKGDYSKHYKTRDREKKMRAKKLPTN